MSSFRQRADAGQDDALTVLIRLGSLIAAVLIVSVAINPFAGLLVFSAGLTLFAGYAALLPATRPLRPSGRVAAPPSRREPQAPAARPGTRRKPTRAPRRGRK